MKSRVLLFSFFAELQRRWSFIGWLVQVKANYISRDTLMLLSAASAGTTGTTAGVRRKKRFSINSSTHHPRQNHETVCSKFCDDYSSSNDNTTQT
mmetsp:Transcript_32721/g.36448  ORF Transcript_32721/g.36448 Transcript_32721/m.36448 type:complete len:95 (+) Transcript_32721:688-972(+)